MNYNPDGIKMTIDKLKDLILYQIENTNKTIEVLYDNEDFWLTKKTMAELFNVKVNTINYHLKDNGKIKRKISENLALNEYEKYRVVQD